MELRTLASTPLPQITAAFNEAFSDYFIRLQFTEEGMAAKIKGEGILPRYSVGAFHGDRLVGFILHGYDVLNGVRTVYNAGTGVVPSFRGQGLTKALYRYVIPLLQNEAIHHHVLEVIDNNLPAKKVYEEVGFTTRRKLAAFRSNATIEGTPLVAIRAVASLPPDPGFAAMLPAWQNTTASIHRDPESHRLVGAFVTEEMVGYAAWVPAAGRVKLCAVHRQWRRRGIGSALFHYMQQGSGTGALVVTNVDEAYRPATQFLHAIGFAPFLGLHEMALAVK